MIESLVLRDPGIRLADRLASSGISLAAADRSGQAGQAGGAGAPAPSPAAPPAAPSNPFDRRDIVDIRGNVRPLAADASVGITGADEDAGGSPGPEAQARQASRGRAPALAGAPPVPVILTNPGSVYEVRGLVTAGMRVQGVPFPRAAPGAADEGRRRARRLAEAFSAAPARGSPGAVLDLAA